MSHEWRLTYRSSALRSTSAPEMCEAVPPAYTEHIGNQLLGRAA